MIDRLKILVVDDSPEDQEHYLRCLGQSEHEHYQVFVADDAESGLEALASYDPDLVLLDYLLPDLDGIEFVRELKDRASRTIPNALSDEQSKHLRMSSPHAVAVALPPIIMLTGQGSEEIAVEAMKEGVVDYVVKQQITPTLLHRTIHHALEQRSLRCALAQAEERFRTSIETMLDCFGTYAAIRNAQGQITGFRTEYINAAACDRSTMEVHQKNDNLYVVEPPQWTDELFQEYCQLVETGVPLVKEIVIYDEASLSKDEPVAIKYAYDLRATRLGDGFVAVWREITGKKRAELERQQLLEQEKQARATAEEASRFKDTVVAMVSHDLRAPLNSIMGWVQMLQRNPNEKTIKQASQIIERSAHSQLLLIEDLLDASRILRGSLALKLQPLNLVTLIDSATTTLYPLIADKQIQLYLDCGNKSVAIETAEALSQLLKQHPQVKGQGDLNRLNQVFSNLLTNAIKFTPKVGEIRLGLGVTDDLIRLSISDSGVGIDPANLKAVFEQFRQLGSEQCSTSKGLGLGLAIAQHIVELHHGKIWAESEGLGKGSTFYVELPRTP